MNKIKHYRKKKNMSLDDLSKASGVAKSSLSMIERGETDPRLKTAYRITNALGKGYIETVFPFINHMLDVE